MEIAWNIFGIYMQHLESLSKIDSQALTRAEIEVEVTHWCNAKYPVHLAIYLNVLTLLKVLSLGLQTEYHDPVTAVRRTTKFDWAMKKLLSLVDNFKGKTGLTNHTQFLKNVTINDGGKHFSKETIQDVCKECKVNLPSCIEKGFKISIFHQIFLQ